MWACFLIFAIITFFGEIVLYFMAIETKNKTDNEIDEIFLKREKIDPIKLKLNRVSDDSSFA